MTPDELFKYKNDLKRPFHDFSQTFWEKSRKNRLRSVLYLKSSSEFIGGQLLVLKIRFTWFILTKNFQNFDQAS